MLLPIKKERKKGTSVHLGKKKIRPTLYLKDPSILQKKKFERFNLLIFTIMRLVKDPRTIWPHQWLIACLYIFFVTNIRFKRV